MYTAIGLISHPITSIIQANVIFDFNVEYWPGAGRREAQGAVTEDYDQIVVTRTLMVCHHPALVNTMFGRYH